MPPHEAKNLVSRAHALYDQYERRVASHEELASLLRSLAGHPELAISLDTIGGGPRDQLLLVRVAREFPAQVMGLVLSGARVEREFADPSRDENPNCVLQRALYAAGDEARRGLRQGPAYQLVRDILALDVDVNRPGFAGFRPLHHAADYPHAALLLLEAGADPRAKAQLGDTPLMMVTQFLDDFAESRDFLKEDLEILLERMKKIRPRRRQKAVVVEAVEGGPLRPARESGIALARALHGWPESGAETGVLAAQASVEAVAKCAGVALRACIHHRSVVGKCVPDDERAVPVLKLKASAWSLVFVSGPGPVGHLEPWRERAADLSKRLKRPVVEVWDSLVRTYEKGRLTRTLEAGAGPDDAIEAFLGQQRLLIPPLGLTGDGADFTLTIGGVKLADVERVDVLILEE